MKSKIPDNSTLQYLNEIPQKPLLTRTEEANLVREIEVYQKQIFESLLDSAYGRREMLDYLTPLLGAGKTIVDISKKLDEESAPEDIANMNALYAQLLKELGNPKSKKVGTLLTKVSLASDILYGIVTEVKRKFSVIYEVEQRSYSVLKWFEGKDPEYVLNIISEIRSNENVRNNLKKELHLNETQMLNKCSEWENSLNAHKAAQKTLHEGVTFADVHNCHKQINLSEFRARKFRDELITRNLRLVVNRARKLLNRGLPFEDLIQEGNAGLIKAVDKYELSKGTKLATYATWWIDQSMRRGLSNKAKTVRIPTNVEWMQTNIYKATQKLVGKLGRPPSLQEISDESSIPVETLEKLETRALHEVGLEEDLAPGLSFLDIIPSDPNQNPHTLTETKILQENIRSILSTLTPRNEKIIRLRFGIGEISTDLQVQDDDSTIEDGLSLQIIGNHMGVTKQAIRQSETISLEKIRKKVKKMNLDV